MIACENDVLLITVQPLHPGTILLYRNKLSLGEWVPNKIPRRRCERQTDRFNYIVMSTINGDKHLSDDETTCQHVALQPP